MTSILVTSCETSKVILIQIDWFLSISIWQHTEQEHLISIIIQATGCLTGVSCKFFLNLFFVDFFFGLGKFFKFFSDNSYYIRWWILYHEIQNFSLNQNLYLVSEKSSQDKNRLLGIQPTHSDRNSLTSFWYSQSH